MPVLLSSYLLDTTLDFLHGDGCTANVQNFDARSVPWFLKLSSGGVQFREIAAWLARYNP